MADSYFTGRSASPLTENGASLLSPPTPTTGPPGRSNALHNRITSVLSASYADLEIRDALDMLDERGTQNTAEARRNLRLDVQEELIQCNGEIVHDFGKVAEQLKRIGSAIANLNTSCVEMRKHINAANRETGPMLDEAKTILADKHQVETKQQLLDAFKKHFVVSDADLAILTSTAEPVNDDFFRVLTRVKKIHEDCQVLLGSENQRLGLEILEQSSRHLNAAFQKLYRWVQREFKTLDLENPQISAAIRRALRVLAERPTLFQNCLDFFAEAREHILSNNFYSALTGAPVDREHPVMGKAIELSAHDPLRYISDMLAWAHSATVSEREALEVLFISEGDEIAKSIKAGIESEPWSRDEAGDATPFDGRKALNELVDRDLTGVFRQLRQRTEQVVQSHEDATLAYKISNLVTFYTSIFANLLGEGSSLLDTLRPLADTAMRSFSSIMRDHVASLHTDLAISTDDLSPPDFLTDALHTLKVLMKSYDTSITTNNREERIEGFQPILQVALNPFLSGCENITKRLRSPNNHIFALNCLFATKEVLSTYFFADQSSALQPRIDAHEAELVEAMHVWFLHESGLKPLVDNITRPEDLNTACKDPSQLISIAQSLDAFLPTATEDARGFLSQLENKTLARRVIEHAAERFCEDFEETEAMVVQADDIRARQVNGGDSEEEMWLRDLFPRTVGDIKVLLS
ncbi:Conserved oligomeric Golgi complex subunit 6 [Fulvia fulva]|nr:Conserved oligomeric Golgi complex subunit 6 [Fulvia fulva]KAK4614897.1 Conserved oligomeric Golgi complex subunit 6 [Fulvia fulva]WPV20101.1 Conserved oligomeric Golgi complex subunit 6 [Fulvia fulva]WPV35708.1 Conserved oligomeric Golgi complex subunit 6 [Fulvia fulva]